MCTDPVATTWPCPRICRCFSFSVAPQKVLLQNRIYQIRYQQKLLQPNRLNQIRQQQNFFLSDRLYQIWHPVFENLPSQFGICSPLPFPLLPLSHPCTGVDLLICTRPKTTSPPHPHHPSEKGGVDRGRKALLAYWLLMCIFLLVCCETCVSGPACRET